MQKFSGTKQEWISMMEDHITNVVSHYKGKVTSWDVVNEAFNKDGTLRENIWKKNIGPEYIQLAFEFAHQADPDALLFYNDYSIMLNPVKRKSVIQYLKKNIANGVPIHGIGLQSHIGIGFPEKSEITQALLDVQELGIKIHLSELDVAVNALGKEIDGVSASQLKRQADVYSFVFNTYKKIPQHLKHGITIWGVNDSNSWIPLTLNRKDYPLLFDHSYYPKPAYCRLIENL